MATPAWFDEQTYLANKAAQLNALDGGAGYEGNNAWTPAQVAEAFKAAGISAYDHFLASGNAENVSPNPYFDVNVYLANKAAQLNTLEGGAGYEGHQWTPDQVAAAFEAAGISAWDHYIQAGTAEFINPSDNFDTRAYLEAKAAQLNAMDGGAGYQGNNQWTAVQVAAVFKEDGISALEHYYDAGEEENLSYSPGDPVVPPVDPGQPGEEVVLTRDNLQYTGTPDNDTFVGVTSSKSSEATLQAADQIDGGAGNDTLRVTMGADFKGFADTGFMKSVETVDLTSSTQKVVKFSAKNVEGADTYNLTGNVNLSDLAAAGITVNAADRTGDLTIGFTADAIKGDSALTLGLNNVGVINPEKGDTPATVTAAGIENLTVSAKGDSVVSLTGVAAMENLTIQGDGNLKVTGVDAALTAIDVDNATGNLDIDATKATALASATLGSGNDVLTVGEAIAVDAAINGGEGDDRVVLSGVAAAKTLQLGMTGVETLEVADNTAAVTLSAANTEGLTTLGLTNMGANVTLAKVADSELNVAIKGTGEGTFAVSGEVETLNVTVSEKAESGDTKQTLTATTAQNLTLNVEKDGAFAGSLVADQATELTLISAGALTLGADTHLDALEELTVQGTSAVKLDSSASIGATVGDLTVNAADLLGDFTAAFTKNTAEDDATLTVTGSEVSANALTVDTSWSSIEITGGIQTDTVNLGTVAAATEDAPKSLKMDLDLGDNIVEADTADFSGWNLNLSNLILKSDAELIFDDNISDVNGVTLSAVSKGVTVKGGEASETFNVSGVALADDGTDLTVELGQGDTVILGTNSETVSILGGSVKIDGFSAGGDTLAFNSAGEFASASGIAAFDSFSFGTTAVNGASNVSSVTYGAQTVGSDSIYVLDGVTADDAADIFGLLVASSAITVTHDTSDSAAWTESIVGSDAQKLYVNPTDFAVVAASNGEGTSIWYISDGDGNGTIESSEVLLVGTLTGVDASTLA